MGDVLQFKAKIKPMDELGSDYKVRINGLNKIELLEEMVRYQEGRSESGSLTPEMMVRGRILFKALEDRCDTDEMRLLASSYRRHLEHEYENYRRGV